MCSACEKLSLDRRSGPPPRTNPQTPHMQLDQIAPPVMRERLIEVGGRLEGVRLGRSGVSIPQSTAFLLDLDRAGNGPPEAFMTPGEFAHVHAVWDGSLHMNLPRDVLETVYSAGWGEQHPAAGYFGFPDTIAMIYGPRTEDEFAVVAKLLRISHVFATGNWSRNQ